MMNFFKAVAAVLVSVALYVVLGMVPVLGPHVFSPTLVVLMPLTWLGGLVGYAALGAFTVKGVLSLLGFGWLAGKLA